MPSSADAVNTNVLGHNSASFTIGAFTVAVSTVWLLLVFASVRPWTVNTCAASMTSLTTSAILGVITFVDTRFMSEKINPASRCLGGCYCHSSCWDLVVARSNVVYTQSYFRCVQNSVISRSSSDVSCAFLYLTQSKFRRLQEGLGDTRMTRANPLGSCTSPLPRRRMASYSTRE